MFILLTCSGFTTVFAQETERIEELEDTVRRLEERLETLEQEAPDEDRLDSGLITYWRDGVRFESADGAFQFHVGGRVEMDVAWFDQDDDLVEQLEAAGSDEPDWGDAGEVRRARVRMEGLLYDSVEFKFQYEFAGGDAEAKDLYMGLPDLPFGSLRVGHFKEPYSLQQLTSSRDNTFMERGLIGSFEVQRNTGAMLHDHVMDDRMTYALGVFRQTDEFGSSSGDGYNFNGHVTGLPLYEEEGRQLVHLGLGYSYRDLDDGVRFRRRPEVHLTPDRLVDTGEFDADTASLVNLESALVYGPLSFQAEYSATAIDSDEGDDPDFYGYYIEASYFLTGEHRPYKRTGGVFTRVRPKRNFRGKEGGPGAWQVAARYSHIDLEDGNINGGEMDTITAGVNWYLNPNTRVTVNYVYADPSELYHGAASIFAARFHVNF
jgi:phosphate-selective porin OprO/OprP